MKRKRFNGQICKFYRKDENGSWIELGKANARYSLSEFSKHNPEKGDIIRLNGIFIPHTDQEILALNILLNSNNEN
jgi:hypothetical protein